MGNEKFKFRAIREINFTEIVHAWGQVIHCCHGNQLMRECLAENMIKEANFQNFFLIQIR